MNLPSFITSIVIVVSFQLELSAAQLIAGWDFNSPPSNGHWRSADGKYIATIVGDAVSSDWGRPHGGGRGLDVSKPNSGYLLFEGKGLNNPLNLAAAEDSMSIVFWQMNFSNINSSTFWADSDSVTPHVQIHAPWSNGIIYFDTMGCCAAPIQRVNMSPGKEHEWVEQWHHYAFIKDGLVKRIYVDAQLLVENKGAIPLSEDATQFFIGADAAGQSPDAIIDDFAIFKGVLSQQDIASLANISIIEPTPKDSDRDGIPDEWELKWGLDPRDRADSRQDPDGDGDNNLTEYRKGTDPFDTTDPILLAAISDCSMENVTLVFSEPLEEQSALNRSHYNFEPALDILDVSYENNKVTLVTSRQDLDSSYLVTVNHVQDLSKNVIFADTAQRFHTCEENSDHVLSFEAWFGIKGSSIEGLADSKFPKPGADAHIPADYRTAISSFNSREAFPDDRYNEYAARIRGYITPAETGEYQIFTRSDDSSELFLSLDENPENITKIAEEVGCCRPFQEPGFGNATTFQPIPLVAGQKYYIEFRYKEGGGGDWGEVAWRKVGDRTPANGLRPIQGQFLSPLEPLRVPSKGLFVEFFPEKFSNDNIPNTIIRIKHLDGSLAWTDKNTRLSINGHVVESKFVKEDRLATITYTPESLFPSNSKVSISLEYHDDRGSMATEHWSFHVSHARGPVLDTVGSYPGIIMGSAGVTADGGGRTGQSGDRGLDFTIKGGSMVVSEFGFLNEAFERDQLTVVYWVKKHGISHSSAFWIESASADSGNRGFQASAPWGNNHVYFDTMGCCEMGTQRLTGTIDHFPGYKDNTFWTENWHLLSFSKNGPVKEVRIDGELFLQSNNALPLIPDVSGFIVGSSNQGNNDLAIFDDFAVFSTALTETDLKYLTAGLSAVELPEDKGLLAFWDFNDATEPELKKTIQNVTLHDGQVVLKYSGTLYFSDEVDGDYSILKGAQSPYFTSPNRSQMFFMVK